MRFETFLFDLDGTLVDSLADLATAVNLLRRELGLTPLDLGQVRSYVGDGASMLVKRALPDGQFSENHLQRFLEHYDAHLQEQTRIYPGIDRFLELNRDKKMAVVTNKPLRFAERLVQGLGLADYFPVILGGDSCPAKKPDPAMVFRALEALGAEPRTAVMVGDHHTDLQAGQAAGIRTCFCAWGLGHHGDLDYDYLAETPHDLPRLFAGTGH